MKFELNIYLRKATERLPRGKQDFARGWEAGKQYEFDDDSPFVDGSPRTCCSSASRVGHHIDHFWNVTVFLMSKRCIVVPASGRFCFSASYRGILCVARGINSR